MAGRSRVKKKATRKPKGAKPPRARMTGQGVQTPDEVVAQIWVLREEGRTLRWIANDVGVNLSTVQRILVQDQERLETLAHAQREERGQLWKNIENKSLKAIDQLLDELHAALFTKAGRRKRRAMTKLEAEFLDATRPWAGILRLAADSASRHQDKLIAVGASPGSSTGEQSGVGGEGIPDDATPEQLAQAAIDLGMVDQLNPVMRAIADKLIREKAANA